MIVITGADGFIGSNLANYFNKRGFRDLILIDKVHPRGYLFNTEFRRYIDSPEDFVFSKKIDFVIHLGANSSTNETDFCKIFQENVCESLKWFALCAEFDVPFIYASSAATYGLLNNTEILDPHSLDSLFLSPYAMSKNRFDSMAFLMKKKPTHWYGLKFFNVYGNNEDHKEGQKSLPFRIRETRGEGVTCYVAPNGEPLERDFIYVQQICEWIYELCQKIHFKDAPKSGIYNMGTGSALPWEVMAKLCLEELGLKDKSIEMVPLPDHLMGGNYQRRTCASMDKLFSAGFKLTWDHRRALKDMYG